MDALGGGSLESHPNGMNDSGNVEEETEADVNRNVLTTPSDQEDRERREDEGKNENQNVLNFHCPCVKLSGLN